MKDAMVHEWQRIAAEAPVHWTGDLDDDCTALWGGLMLRAEEMDRGRWWWAVYDRERGDQDIASSHDDPGAVCRNGKEARQAAERAAREYLAL